MTHFIKKCLHISSVSHIIRLTYNVIVLQYNIRFTYIVLNGFRRNIIPQKLELVRSFMINQSKYQICQSRTSNKTYLGIGTCIFPTH